MTVAQRLRTRITDAEARADRLRQIATHPTVHDEIGAAKGHFREAGLWLDGKIEAPIEADTIENVEFALQLGERRLRHVEEALNHFGPGAILDTRL